jgi:hypothetical protein
VKSRFKWAGNMARMAEDDGDKGIQNFGGENSWKMSNPKTKEEMGG